jgi:uncharacterized protein YcbX
MGIECRLVHMAPGFLRDKSGSTFDGFPDSYPLTIISDDSIEDVNKRIKERRGEPITNENLRSDIRVAGCGAYREDEWGDITIQDKQSIDPGVDIQVVKPVVRCKIPQYRVRVDEEGNRYVELSKEPAGTLNGYRRIVTVDEKGKKHVQVLLAQKARHVTTGEIKVGDNVIVHSYKESPKFK